MKTLKEGLKEINKIAPLGPIIKHPVRPKHKPNLKQIKIKNRKLEVLTQNLRNIKKNLNPILRDKQLNSKQSYEIINLKKL